MRWWKRRRWLVAAADEFAAGARRRTPEADRAPFWKTPIMYEARLPAAL